MTDSIELFTIGVVERDTGIARDTLRVWERRYGFPSPQRNDRGERVYPEQQVRRLQRVRRLLDQGLRPGKVLSLNEQALCELETGLLNESTANNHTVDEIMQSLQSSDAEEIINLLKRSYDKQGMQGFIHDTVTPLLKAVGDSWAGGQLQIYQEHFLSQQLMRFLNAEIEKLQKTSAKPAVLLATLPGEDHTLGLLMLSALLSAQGLSVINLGSSVPMDQLAKAADNFNVDIVALTFSGAYQYKSIRSHIIELRQVLIEDIDIWVGGEGVKNLRKLPVGVSKFKSMGSLPV